MNYLQPQTLGSLLRNTFSIYFRHWATIVAIAAVPTIPAGLLRVVVQYSNNRGALIILFLVVEVFARIFVGFPLVVAVSEACIGLKPNFARSYQRAFAKPGMVLGTYLAVSALSIMALIAFVIPVFFVTAFYIFVGPVVILEQIGGKAAFRRSRELGRGYYLRNLGIFIVASFTVLLLTVLISMVIGMVLGIAVYLFDAGRMTNPVSEVIGVAVGQIAAPLGAIPLLLLYYDMRSRKEGYGAPQLMEDLKY